MFNKVILFLRNLFKETRTAFFFTLAIYFISLIANTSFKIMGFDLTTEILSAFNIDFLPLLLFTSFKILLLYFLFFASIQFILYNLYEDFNIEKRYYFPYFLGFILLISLHSIANYPQVYADFFYTKHPYLQGLLYLITDHLSPLFIFYLFHFIFFVYAIYLIVNIYISKNLKQIYLLLYILSFLFFHLEGLLSGVAASYIILKFFYKKAYIIERKNIVLSHVLIFALLSISILIKITFYIPNKKDINKPSIFILSADSLRKDRIGFKRNGESITPNIDKLIIDSFSFEDHHVTIPRTFPSWADLLTGSYSMSHKIRDMFPAEDEVKNIGSDKFPTIGNYLKEREYRTAVFSNFAGDIFPRADFGFDDIYAPDFNAKILIVQKSLDSQVFLLPILTGSIFGGGEYFSEIESFSNLGDGKRILKKEFRYIDLFKDFPLFVTAFFSVTHFPYSPPYPFYNKFTDPNYYGEYKYFKFVNPTSNEKPTEKEIEQIRAIFDSSINSFDSSIGEFIEYLKENELYENSIIVLTGDHGESIYEDVHGHGHGEHLRGENITKVPLIIKFPKQFTNEILKTCIQKNPNDCNKFQGVTSSIDIMPTLLDYLHIQAKTDIPGRSLLKILTKSNWTDDRLVYAESGIWFSDIGDHFFQKQRIMYPNILKLHRIVPENNYQIMITDPFYRDTIAFSKHRELLSSKYKFIYIPTNDGVIFEMYDRINDPLNIKNLYPAFPSEQMKQEIYKLSEKWEGSKIIENFILPPPIIKE
jgi:arylsulfatase A-like enzyme